jgi:hypothetical protein
MQPDVILLKEGLPLMKGHGVAPLMGTMPSARSIPIVLYGKQRQMHNTDVGSPLGVSISLTSCNGAELLGAATKTRGV